MIKVFTAFSGYDSQCMALERLGVDYDLVLLVPNADCPYLCIELKTPKGKVQDTQKMYKEAVTNAGGRYEVVRCFDDFKSIIEDYLGVVK